MGRKKDRFWEYAEELNGSFKCNFCQRQFCGGISRIKAHLAKVTGRDISVCTKVPENVQGEAFIAVGGPNKKVKAAPSTSNFEKNKTTSTSSSSPSTTLHHSTALELHNNKDKSAVNNLLAKHVLLNNIPIDVVQTESFRCFVQGVAEYGCGYSLPSDSTLKTKLVSDLRMEVDDYIRKVKESWATTGCTLMLDIWSDKKQGDFISIIAYSPKGAVFMKPFEIPNDRKEELNLANILSSVIEEIGHDNVVQFITNAKKFESVGDELVRKYPRMYKTRCAAHGIHLLLKDIYEKVDWVKKVIDDANLIVTYMHKNTIISSLMREQTNKKELKRPCMTRFASNFLMLQSIFVVKNELRSLVASSEWRELDCNKEGMAKRVTTIIGRTDFWSQGQEVLEIFNPFVRVLQLAESDGSTSGYLYEAMERAKGGINQQCGNNQSKYMQIWKLFEERHYESIIHPIHAAAAYLNPAYMCSENFRNTPKMMVGINFIQENLVASEERKNFIDDVQSYHIKPSKLFTNMAITMLKTSHPRIWWELNGYTLPTLQKYAIKILSQPCSSSSCKRNWSAFEVAHTKNRNRLAPELLDNLMYVRMNTMMMEKFKLLEDQCTKPIDLDKLSELPEYVEHEKDWEDHPVVLIDDGFDDDVIMKDADSSQLDAQDEKPIDMDKPSEPPEYADHEQDCEGNAMDTIDEAFDDTVITNDADSLRLNEAQGTNPIDLDKTHELSEYADNEQGSEGDGMDARDEGFDDTVITNVADSLRLNENSFDRMEIVGEPVVSDRLQQLFNMLNSPGLREFAQQQVNTELKKWEKFLLKIDAVLDDAENKQIWDLLVENWRSKLEDLVFDAEDILEEIEALRHTLMVKPCASSSGLDPSANFNVKIDEITSRLEDIVTQADDLHLTVQAGRRTNKLREPTTSLVDESHVYGREKDKEAILELLLKDERSDGGVCVISIIGTAGVGKTTLAQLVYNDDKVNGCFNMRAWVYVSKENNIHRITNTIIREVTLETDVWDDWDDWDDRDELEMSLRDHLQGNKFLLVLDDVWNQSCDQWHVLYKFFMAGALGSKIIVTTRDQSVASTMGTFFPYHLKELSFDDCLPLFAHHALERELFDEHSNLKLVGEDIVRKCKGLPLAVKTLGSLLRNTRNCDDWKKISNTLEEDNEHLPILSYLYLPSHLKRCFAYCAIFPKGFEFDKDELVLLWMAEGFLQEQKGKKHMEDLGLEYFHELLSRSLFQQSSRNESCFEMHDIINDIAKSVAGEIYFNLGVDKVNKSFDKVRHLAFNPSPTDVSQRFKVIDQMMGLRTFLASSIPRTGYNCLLSNNVLYDLLPKLKYLRALSLSGYRIRELPDSIGGLMLLRYLNLSNSNIQQLPESLSALLKLQTLILSGCRRLTKLPDGIGHLTNLHLLDIVGTNNLNEMPSGIGNLTSLQTLSKFIVGKGDGLRARDLKNLLHLRGQLSILKLHNVVHTRDAWDANLKEKQGLDDLVLKLGDDMGWITNFQDTVNERDKMQILEWLQPHRNLKKLTIASYDGTEFPPWIGDPSFSNLVQLNLCYCRKSTSLPSLGGLPLLKDLRIEGMKAVRIVGLEFYGVGSNSAKAFPSLECLSFKNMLGWEEWFSCTGDVFPCLRKLVIQNCPKLNGELLSLLVAMGDLHCPTLPNSSVSLPSLDELEISECNLVILTRLVNVISLTTLKIKQISGLASLDILAQVVALEVVEIENCSEVVYLWEDGANLEKLACLKKLIVKNCGQVVSLASEEWGVLPRNLEELEFVGCHNLKKLPNGLHSLTCLRSLIIKSCSQLVSFPATGLPYTLRRLELHDWEALESLPNNQCLLEELVVEDCPSLKSLPRGMLPTTLKKLKISECWNLESLPEGMMLDDNDGNNTSQLKSLEILDCWGLESLSERILLNNTSLEVICLRDCWYLRSLPLEYLHRLTHLSELEIRDCPALESFPESGFSIPNLKSLKLEDCYNLKSLPNQMHNLTSLQTLIIWVCPKIESFPEGGLPPNLTSLEISYCWNLKQSMSEWRLSKLSSLRKFTLQFSRYYSCPLDDMVSFPDDDDDCCLLPTTLTYIRIRGISNVESISKGIQNLTSLEKLEIWWCPKLHSLPKEGLPASLGYLKIFWCPLLKEKCLKEKGEYWPMISHIPRVKIDLEIQ